MKGKKIVEFQAWMVQEAMGNPCGVEFDPWDLIGFYSSRDEARDVAKHGMQPTRVKHVTVQIFEDKRAK